MAKYLLAIDQGTTSSRAIIFNEHAKSLSQHQIDLQQTFPAEAWVEQDAEEMFQNTLICCREALKKVNLSATDIAAIGITNQRETTIIWDKRTGQTIYPAIVWQDRRTANLCNQFSLHPIHQKIQEKTGLLLDPYFSATKILWILENVPNARERALKGELLFGTVDTYLLWRFTKGVSHATDATNASRTLLFNINTQEWDEELLNAFNIPKNLLPKVLDSSDDFGLVDESYFGHKIPITAMIGDQQAATVGHACFQKGSAKITYGTGAFMVLNTGDEFIHSKHRLLSTIAYRLNGKVTYALEGSIFSAGSIIKWLRDNLKLISSSGETESIAKSIESTEGVYLVPAFTGLGAPYWKPDARALICGMTSSTQAAHIVRAALEAVCYQTKDLLECVKQDGVAAINHLRVDGGMSVNDWLLQFLANLLGLPVSRPLFVETSAMGAIFLAGLRVGIYKSLDAISELCKDTISFTAENNNTNFEELYLAWREVITSYYKAK